MVNKGTNTNSKRIASNTMVLFVRMFIMTIINLYAVRFVLNGLGKDGYGIFTSVTSVVAVASVLNVVLALSIQRFYSFYLGKKDAKVLNEIFSSSVNIVVFLSVCVIAILETVGLWLIYTQLTIPQEQIDATLWVYQFSILTLILSILQIPYTAAVFAHEDMKVYTWISTIECLLKFADAWSIVYAFINSLVFYAAGLLVTSIIISITYIIIGRRRYNECHYHTPSDKNLYKKLLSFSGWTFFGSAANTGMIQGNTILLNVFWGPIITAAFGIAQQINNAFNTLCNTMVLAFRPPMIKAYAEHNYDYLNKLFSVSNKFIFYLLLMVAIPIITEMETILSLWLNNTSTEIVLFSRLIIVYVICLAMNNPITIIIQASGRVKAYHLPVETTTLFCLPITWLLFSSKCPAYTVFYSMIGVVIIAHAVRCVCLKRSYPHFSYQEYILSFILPAIAITGLSIFTSHLILEQISKQILHLLVAFTCIPIIIIILTYILGISKRERELLKNLIRQIVYSKSCQK